MLNLMSNSQGHALGAPLDTACPQLVVKVHGAAEQTEQLQYMFVVLHNSTAEQLHPATQQHACGVAGSLLTCSKRTGNECLVLGLGTPSPTQQALDQCLPSSAAVLPPHDLLETSASQTSDAQSMSASSNSTQ
jgi:hypothetical protein